LYEAIERNEAHESFSSAACFLHSAQVALSVKKMRRARTTGRFAVFPGWVVAFVVALEPSITSCLELNDSPDAGV
jgi:hypothetical protein